MGEGEEVKTKSEPQVEIQERGEIFFFYRPKVGKEESHSQEEVQRLYIVLRPESLPGEKAEEEMQDPHSGKAGSSSSPERGSNNQTHQGGYGSQKVDIEKEPLLRFIVMGRKSLPDPSKKGQPYWGFVDLVTTNIDQVKSALEGEEYDTATRGHRHTAPARAVGEGIYRILKHGNSGGRKRAHTHLIYRLEFPAEEEGNEPQESLNLEREGSFLIQIKNPDQQQGGSSGFQGLQSKRKAAFPASLQGQLGHLRFCPADPPDFLNYEGCEFLLVSASDDIEEELGLELKTYRSCSDLVNMFGETAVTTPLLRGTWG